MNKYGGEEGPSKAYFSTQRKKGRGVESEPLGDGTGGAVLQEGGLILKGEEGKKSSRKEANRAVTYLLKKRSLA